MNQRTRIVSLIALIAQIIAAGTVFFHFVEGWSWLDSYFFSVITLSTVGYGSLVPATALGKIGTTVFIFLGIGIFAAVIQQFSQVAVERRLRILRRLKAKEKVESTKK
ncbi:potassium channel family protein [Cognatishimia sp. WU-CL00825]|uniref:potassium channel family protein n=1 Tax=Cognatishimia sp. WU-CL00825 TaxID=3127658 RepID=UPI003103F93E